MVQSLLTHSVLLLLC